MAIIAAVASIVTLTAWFRIQMSIDHKCKRLALPIPKPFAHPARFLSCENEIAYVEVVQQREIWYDIVLNSANDSVFSKSSILAHNS